jgi:hypothetical protein
VACADGRGFKSWSWGVVSAAELTWQRIVATLGCPLIGEFADERRGH